MLTCAIILYSLSLLTQSGATFYAFLLAKEAPPKYRWGWISLGTGLGLMLGRRISPIVAIIDTGYFNISDAALSLPISILLLIGTIGIHKLLSKLNSGNEFLTLLSLVDPLTKALSRQETFSRLLNELNRFKRNNHSFAVIEIDIDFFKKINDSYGHDSGDDILRELSQLIQSQLREIDHFGRIGGEEFLIILPDTNEDSAKDISERIRLVVKKHLFHTRGQDMVKITISQGIAMMDISNKDLVNIPSNQLIDMLYKRSDKAMYRAKSLGRDRVVSFSQIIQME